MAIKIVQKRGIATEKNIKGSHLLLVLDDVAAKAFPYHKELNQKLKRTHKKTANLAKEPVTIEIENGRVLSFVILDKNNNTFQRHTLIRKALQPFIAENPEVLSIAVFGDEALKEINVRAAVYVALMNSQTLPSYKAKLQLEAMYGRGNVVSAPQLVK